MAINQETLDRIFEELSAKLKSKTKHYDEMRPLGEKHLLIAMYYRNSPQPMSCCRGWGIYSLNKKKFIINPALGQSFPNPTKDLMILSHTGIFSLTKDKFLIRAEEVGYRQLFPGKDTLLVKKQECLGTFDLETGQIHWTGLRIETIFPTHHHAPNHMQRLARASIPPWMKKSKK